MSQLALSLGQQALVTDHRHIALGIAGRMWRTRRHLPREDFVSSADLGLVQAARTYEAAREVPFPPYASCRIVGAIRDWIGDESRFITIRRAARECALGVAAQLDEDEGGFEADDAFYRQSVSDRAMAIRAAFIAGFAVSALSARRAEGSPDHMQELGSYWLAIDALRDCIATLPDRDRDVLAKHYSRGGRSSRWRARRARAPARFAACTPTRSSGSGSGSRKWASRVRPRRLKGREASTQRRRAARMAGRLRSSRPPRGLPRALFLSAVASTRRQEI